MSLFEAWYEIETRNGSKQGEVLARLNAACGTKYKSNWVSLVRRGEQGLSRCPDAVRHYMMKQILQDRLGDVLSPEKLAELFESVL